MIGKKSRLALTTLKASIVILVLTLNTSWAQEPEFSPPRDRISSRNIEVMKALSGFVYAMRHRLPAYAVSFYQPCSNRAGPNRTSPSNTEKELSRFFSSYSSAEGKPLIYLAKPRITWRDDEAVVRCITIWNAIDKNGTRVSLRRPECFVLKKRASGFVIVYAESTPTVMKYLGNPEKLRKALVLKERGGSQ